MRRCLLLALALVAGATAACRVDGPDPGTESAVPLPFPPSSDAFTVAILADRTTGFDSGLAVLEQAVEELNLLCPDLVFHVGDMVPGYTRDMDRWRADIRKVKDILGRLEVPFYPVAGNHDVITGTGDPADRRGEQLYREHFGPLYYSLDYRGTHFVVLYSDEALESVPRFSDDQIDWLRRDLEESGGRPVFVLVHKPAWEYAESNWPAVHDILRRHPVRAVIAGHFHHYYRAQKVDGIQHYVIGVTGGRTFSPELAGGFEHYCLLRVRADSYRLALVKPGCVLPDDYVRLEDFKAMEKLRFLSHREVGATGSVRSPERGPVREPARLLITNPLETALPLQISFRAGCGAWRAEPPERALQLAPGSRREVSFMLASPQVEPEHLEVPEFEVEYEYVDSRDRPVRIALARRVPLRRAATLPLRPVVIEIDGRANEDSWRDAALLSTVRWRTGPYETDEPGPHFRVLAGTSGLYLYAKSRDDCVADFRSRRVLSDALFVGAVAETARAGPAEVVVVYPFPPAGAPAAVRAPWDYREIAGRPVEGVRCAGHAEPPGGGWACEVFVPWRALGVQPGTGDRSLSFNVGAWDNDGRLFTELYSWAPTEGQAGWGALLLEGTEEN